MEILPIPFLNVVSSTLMENLANSRAWQHVLKVSSEEEKKVKFGTETAK